MFHIEIWLNDSALFLRGYEESDHIYLAAEYVSQKQTVLGALDEAFDLFNRDLEELAMHPLYGSVRSYRASQHRSLSVGDVVVVNQVWWYTCEPLGWRLVPSPVFTTPKS